MKFLEGLGVAQRTNNRLDFGGKLQHDQGPWFLDPVHDLGANYKKILRLSYHVIITYDNRKSNLR